MKKIVIISESQILHVRTELFTQTEEHLKSFPDAWAIQNWRYTIEGKSAILDVLITSRLVLVLDHIF